MEMYQRLRSARTKAGYLRAAHAARAMNINQQTYSSHENGNRGFGRDAAILYARQFNVGLEWLLTGSEASDAADTSVTKADRRQTPATGLANPYDPETFRQAAAMVEEFKLDMGFKFVSTPDYLQLIETFYEQACAVQVNQHA